MAVRAQKREVVCAMVAAICDAAAVMDMETSD
jgi:hypothetical protein